MSQQSKFANTRQMPKTKEYLAHKGYSDIVYAWLQVNSLYDKENDVRYINKKEVKFTRIADELGISRQTASTRFKNLLDEEGLNLIKYNKELNRYELIHLDKKLAFLVQKETLRKMVSALNENSINIYVYLYNRFFAEPQGFDFTLDQIKRIIGISDKTRSNNYIITDILEMLSLLGLIEYDIKEVRNPNDYKTIYHLNKVNSEFKQDVKVGREVVE